MNKAEILKIIDALPEDADVEDAVDELYLAAKVEEGEDDMAAGRAVSQEEAKKRMAKWLRSTPLTPGSTAPTSSSSSARR